MELRKLATNEHGSTRSLWEKVFPEDSKQFLDYYYFLKACDNEIYVMEDDAIHSMIHLNPYKIQVNDLQFTGHYIIAVATEPSYRKKGFMGQLLKKTMQEMYERKELFTFLMPAEEKIYTPYDFRFVYDQNVWIHMKDVTKAELNQGCEVEVQEAGIGDVGLLANFFNMNFKEQYQIYAIRNENYYQRLLLEQQSENGGIRIIKKNGQMIGSFLYGDEGELEVRELLYLSEYEQEILKVLSALCEEKRYESAHVFASPMRDAEKKPVIMFRILHLESLLKVLKVKPGEQIRCSFAVLDSLIPQNSRIWRLKSDNFQYETLENENCIVQEENKMNVSETEDSEGVLTIGALTSLLFGYKTVEQIAQEPNVFMTERLVKELGKLELLDRIYLNEIV